MLDKLQKYKDEHPERLGRYLTLICGLVAAGQTVAVKLNDRKKLFLWNNHPNILAFTSGLRIAQLQAIISLAIAIYLCKKVFLVPLIPDDTRMRLIFLARGALGGKFLIIFLFFFWVFYVFKLLWCVFVLSAKKFFLHKSL